MQSSNKTKVSLIQQASLLLFGGALAGCIMLNVVPNQPWQLGVWSIINCFITLLMVLLAYKLPRYQFNGHILIANCMYIVFMPSLLSGGVNSQFAVVIPILPLLACLIVHTKAAWISTGLSIVGIMFMGLNDLSHIDFTASHHDTFQRISHMIWLMIASSASFFFSLIYATINSELNNKLKTQAYNDELTKIPNRRSILQFSETALFALNKELNEKKQLVLSLLLLDIDHFKSVNDTYGHHVGDNCLINVAQLLQESVRRDIDAVGRYGGEEFLICLLTETPNQAESIANKLRQAISNVEHKVPGESNFTITASIGLMSVSKGAGIDIHSIVSFADKALYQAKASGRNKVLSFHDIKKKADL